MDLTAPIETLRGVGPVYQGRLKKLGLSQVKDLLYYFPHRYEDFSNITPIAKAKIKRNIVFGNLFPVAKSRAGHIVPCTLIMSLAIN